MFYGVVVAGWILSVTFCWTSVWLFFGGLISLVAWDSMFMSMSEWHMVLRLLYAILCFLLTALASTTAFAAIIDENMRESFDEWVNNKGEDENA